MKKTVREYQKGCEWCNATGHILNLMMSTTIAITDVCPVCKGAKVIIVTETIIED